MNHQPLTRRAFGAALGMSALALAGCTGEKPTPSRSASSAASPPFAELAKVSLTSSEITVTPFVDAKVHLRGGHAALIERYARVSAIDLPAGTELWTADLSKPHPDKVWTGVNLDALALGVTGGTRPLVVVAVAPLGASPRLAALDLRDGTVRWVVPFPRATTRSDATLSPVLGNDTVVAVGSGDLIVALDPASGATMWQRPGLVLRGVMASAVLAGVRKGSSERAVILELDSGKDRPIDGGAVLDSSTGWVAFGDALAIAGGQRTSAVIDVTQGKAEIELAEGSQVIGTDHDGRELIVWADTSLRSWRDDEGAPFRAANPRLVFPLSIHDGVVWVSRNSIQDFQPVDRAGRELGPVLEAPIVAFSKDWLVERVAPDKPSITVHKVARG